MHMKRELNPAHVERLKELVNNSPLIKLLDMQLTDLGPGRATVELAFERAINQNGNVTGPKALGVFGSSYLFPIFQTVGIIRSIESEGEVKKCRGEKDQRT